MRIRAAKLSSQVIRCQWVSTSIPMTNCLSKHVNNSVAVRAVHTHTSSHICIYMILLCVCVCARGRLQCGKLKEPFRFRGRVCVIREGPGGRALYTLQTSGCALKCVHEYLTENRSAATTTCIIMRARVQAL